MRPDHRAIDEEVLSQVTAIAVRAFPELPADTLGFPAAEAVVHGIPVPKLLGHIPPGNASAGDIEDRFDEEAVTEFRRAAGLLLNRRESRFNLRSGSVSEEQAYGHQRFPPNLDHGGKRQLRPLIHQHNLVRPGPWSWRRLPQLATYQAKSP
jgi:hypothetical protein